MKILGLHGNLGSVSDWDATESALGDSIERADLWENADIALDQFASEVILPRLRKLKQSAGIGERVIVVGYSLGGRLALPLLKQPEAVSLLDQLFLVSTHPGLSSPEERALRLEHDQVWASRFHSEEPLEGILSDWNEQAVFEAGQISAEQVAVTTRYRREIGQAFDRWSLGRQGCCRTALSEASLPISLVVGQRDAKFAALAKAFIETSSRLEVNCLPQVGHRILLEAPEKLAGILRGCAL